MKIMGESSNRKRLPWVEKILRFLRFGSLETEQCFWSESIDLKNSVPGDSSRDLCIS